jgi:hypothetical protein
VHGGWRMGQHHDAYQNEKKDGMLRCIISHK